MNQKWLGRVWLNPPYGRETFSWLNKLSTHRNGIALIFARTETKGFHKEIWEKAHSIFFFKGRISFHKVCGEKGNCANAPSCLISYNSLNTQYLRNSGLNGRLVIL